MIITNKETTKFTTLKNIPKDWDEFLSDPLFVIPYSEKSIFTIGFHTKEERDSFENHIISRESKGLSITIEKNESKNVKNYFHIQNHFKCYNIYEGESDNDFIEKM